MALATPKLLQDRVPHLKSVPVNFIRPVWDRPNISQVEADTIPLIDLHGLSNDNRNDVISQISDACQNYGFFQVTNHGISEEVVNKMLEVARAFFKLPEEDRMQKYSDDPGRAVRLATSFNVNAEKVSTWRDFLRLQCLPPEDYIQDWPSNPPSFKEDVGSYCKSVRGLALWLLEAMSESLGLEADHAERILGKQAQHMAINYYPPCPEPELTFGLPAHTDPNAITLLLQDDVPGLQVLKNDKWVAVSPLPGTFIINIGDQVQVMSNGRYRSAVHRAIVNAEHERISIPTFYCPSFDAVIQPAASLVDDAHPAMYKSYTYGEYYDKFWIRGLATESCLDMFEYTT